MIFPQKSRKHLSRCFGQLGTCSLVQQALTLGEYKIDIHERFVIDVLPENHAISIDQESTMQRLFLEIIVGLSLIHI